MWGDHRPGGFDTPYKLTGLMDWAKAVAAAGVKPIIPIMGSAPWARSSGDWRQPPTSEQHLWYWYRYANDMATMFKGIADTFEVWNEPDQQTYYTGTPSQFATLLTRAHDGIKLAQPQAKVISGGVISLVRGGNGLAWLVDMLRAGPRLDVLGLHPYASNLAEIDRISEQIRNAQAVMWSAGRNYPIWVTEMGFEGDVAFSSLPADIQRSAINRMLAQADGAGAEVALWYAFDHTTRYGFSNWDAGEEAWKQAAAQWIN